MRRMEMHSLLLSVSEQFSLHFPQCKRAPELIAGAALMSCPLFVLSKEYSFLG